MLKEWTGDNTAEFAVMTREAVRAFDAWAINEMGIPGVVLMENAAGHCSRVIAEHYGRHAREGVCLFCGAGNNGGDGFVIARHLHNAGMPVKIVLCADPAKIKGDAKVNYDICRAMGLPMQAVDLETETLCGTVEDAVAGCGLLVDAVLGTGLQGELKSEAAVLISSINSHNIPIVAVDIPSGLDCDRGVPLPVCVEATATVTFVALKQGFVDNPESRAATGRVFVADIGVTPA